MPFILYFDFMIRYIDYNEIYHIWRNDLWPERTSEITHSSAMSFLGGYDLRNMSEKTIFLGYIIDNEIAGVNSLHPCIDGSYRSRGLFVYPKFRGKGIGYALLMETVRLSSLENANYIWSYPKKSSWKTYQRAGFELASDWELSELDYNAYCIKKF